MTKESGKKNVPKERARSTKQSDLFKLVMLTLKTIGLALIIYLFVHLFFLAQYIEPKVDHGTARNWVKLSIIGISILIWIVEMIEFAFPDGKLNFSIQRLQLEGRIDKLNKELSVLRSTSKVASGALSEVAFEFHDLCRQRDDALEAAKQSDAELQKARDEIAALNEAASKSEAANAELQAEVAKLLKQATDGQAEISRLGDDVTRLNAELTDSQAEGRNQQEEIGDLNARVQELELELQELHQEEGPSSHRLAGLEKEHTELNLRIQQLEQSLQQANATVERARGEATSANSTNSVLRAQLADLQSQLSESQASVARLTEKLAVLRAGIKSFEAAKLTLVELLTEILPDFKTSEDLESANNMLRAGRGALEGVIQELGGLVVNG